MWNEGLACLNAAAEECKLDSRLESNLAMCIKSF